MYDNKKIGQKIKEFREKQEISQQELAEALGYKTDTAISLIEKGERGLSIKKLILASKFLKVTLNELVGEDDKEYNIRSALRVDGLNEDDVDQIDNFIKFIKQKSKESEKSQTR